MDELGVSDMTARRDLDELKNPENYLEFMVEHKAFLFQWTTN